jgi:S-DNA-T family DNA segregation ATPase FtsK/SpoIIIE
MFFLFRLVPFGSRGIAFAALVAFGAYVATVQPDWAIDPLRDGAEAILERFGAGIGPFGVWALVLVWVLFRRPSLLFRRWRLVLGSTAFVFGLLGLLSYFEAELPLIDAARLGGSVGDRVQDDGATLGYATVAGLMAIGVWLIVPALTNRALRGVGKGAGKTAMGSAHAYQIAPLHRGLGKVVGGLARGGRAAAKGGTAAVHSYREQRAQRRSRELGQEVGDFLKTHSPGASGEGRAPGSTGIPSGDQELPPFLQSQRPPESPSASVETSPVAADVDGATGGPAAPADEPSAAAPTKKERTAASKPAPAAAWRLPEIATLNAGVAAAAITAEHHATAELIEEALAQHGVEVSVAEIKPGPSVTMFGLVPGWNRRRRPETRRPAADGDAVEPRGKDVLGEARNRVKVDSILAREKDLALALAAPSLRIEAPVPGESIVGVEVPNKSFTTVTIRAVMETDEYRAMLREEGLPVALGLASAGEPVALNLLKMPHLLIAGATGSGKSVCMNSIISSLITHQPPSKLRLLLVDPKRVELTPYNGIPHLVTPVVVEPDRVVRLLRGAIQEMSRRYKLLEAAGVRNIESYNRSSKAVEEMPYFVICIDELADLMMTASFDVEQGICRLAQLGRATGIHMVVATQRPSVDVVTGLIKANFPSRIAFAMASQVDSRTILDTVGAERLLGRGDMLVLSPDAAKPRRVQGVLITEAETEALVTHWREHPVLPVPEINLEDLAYESEVRTAEHDAQAAAAIDKTDSLYNQALQLAAANRQLSTSLLQRRLAIGYPRAARLMDQLEAGGIVGPSAEAGKPREVLYLPEDV